MKRAFTLVEVLVSLWIVATVFASLVMLHVQAIRTVQRTVETAIALSIALERSTLTYLEVKHNVEIAEVVMNEYPDWEIETDVVDFSSLLSAVIPIQLQVPPVPYFVVRSPDGVEVEFVGR